MSEQPTSHRDPDHASVYPENASKATPALTSLLKEKISQQGPIPFSLFMEAALYHPDHGYYSSTRPITGKQGDFITSISIGPCFGNILARRIHSYWQSIGEPDQLSVIEPGAHDGALAHDILDAANEISQTFYRAIHYHLIERSTELIDRQSVKLLPSHSKKFTTHTSLTDVAVAQGVILSNELIDAFPVELIRFNGSSWNMLYVDLDTQDAFKFTPAPIQDIAIKNFTENLKGTFPEGYTTEYNTGIQGYTDIAANTLQSGLFITIDYGHTHQDYYHPHRESGTLQTYRDHQKADDPLSSPGACDITAHVDFSRLEQSALHAGFKNPRLVTQASYLTEHAKSWLLEMEANPELANPSLLKQFQTLTHPSMLGTRFLVLEMEK